MAVSCCSSPSVVNLGFTSLAERSNRQQEPKSALQEKRKSKAKLASVLEKLRKSDKSHLCSLISYPGENPIPFKRSEGGKLFPEGILLFWKVAPRLALICKRPAQILIHTHNIRQHCVLRLLGYAEY